MRKKIFVLFFLGFFCPQIVFGAVISQCQTDDKGNQINCSKLKDTEILKEQCPKTYDPVQCVSMESYLSAMQKDCQKEKPSGINCFMITSGGFYGNEAAKFAAHLEGGPAPKNTGQKALGELDFPDEFGLPDPPGGVRELLVSYLSGFLQIFGYLALLAFAISGFQYLLSSGDETKITTAKRNLTYSILGVIAGLAGFVVVKAVEAVLSAAKNF